MGKLITLLTLAALAGCSTTTPPAPAASPIPSTAPEQDHRLSLTVAGQARDYVVHEPTGYVKGRTYPLVLAFHGNPSTPSQLMSSSKLNPTADAKGFLVVYPAAKARWNSKDDLDFVKALLDKLTTDWGADTKRTYATGFSAGGEFSYYLARDLPGRLAAIAPVSASAPGLGIARPIPLLTFQGGQDLQFKDAFATTNQQWRQAAGCGPEAVSTVQMYGSDTQRRAATCTNGGEHIIYAISGMGHSWPSDANEVIWEFFTRHPLG